jgi:hypothetical protein
MDRHAGPPQVHAGPADPSNRMEEEGEVRIGRPHPFSRPPVEAREIRTPVSRKDWRYLSGGAASDLRRVEAGQVRVGP